MVENKAVEVAEVKVVPPLEETESTVEVAPLAVSATTCSKLRLDKEEVAETVRMAAGAEVATPSFPKT